MILSKAPYAPWSSFIYDPWDKNEAYSFIYQKLKSRLTLAKANSLNHARRLTLIQSIFASIPIYHMANILFNKNFLAKITSIIRTLWWHGFQKWSAKKPIHYRSWDSRWKPKKERGLCIRKLDHVTKVCLAPLAALFMNLIPLFLRSKKQNIFHVLHYGQLLLISKQSTF